MQNISKLLIGALTACLTAPVWAASIVVDGNSSPTGVEVVSFTFENDVLTIVTNGDNVIGPAGGVDPEPEPEPEPTGPVKINSVTSNFSSVETGQNVLISWSTTNAVSCVPQLGNDQWKQQTITPLSSGSVAITIDHVGEVLYRLRCDGAVTGDTRYLGVRITGTEPATVGQSSCTKSIAERPLYSGTSRAVSWFSIFGGVYPAPLNKANANIAVPKGSYTAIKFNSGTGGGGGVALANSNPILWALASVSPCEADFDVPEACRTIVNVGGLGFSTLTTSGWCKLAPDTEYFLNLTYGSSDFNELGDSTLCSSSTCPKFELQYNQQR